MGVVAFLCGWYTVVRLRAEGNAIRVIDLGAAVSSERDETAFLRLACYNIAHARGGKFGLSSWEGGGRKKKRERVQEMARLLRGRKVDIVVLNEVDFDAAWSGGVDQAALLAREAGLRYVVEERNTDAALPFVAMRTGNAILSRFPVSDARYVRLPALHKHEAKYLGYHNAVMCTVSVGEMQIRVLGVHFEWRSEEIRADSAEIVLGIEKESDVPLIVLGDFNSAPSGYLCHLKDGRGRNAMDLLFGSGRFQALPAEPPEKKDCTFPSENPDRVIDWVLVPRGWQVRERMVPASDLSDHLPVVVEVGRPEIRQD